MAALPASVKPLAITGLGVVSPIGIGREAWVRAISDPEAARRSAFGGELTVLAPESVPDALAAEVWGFDATEYLGKKGLRNFDRLTRFLIVAAKFALEDAALKRDGAHLGVRPERMGICSATAYGSLDAITELVKVSELEDPRYVNPGRFPNTVINTSAAYVSIWEDLRAPNITLVDGNCGSLDAVLSCETHLVNGRADVFLVGGGEVLSEPLYLAFRKLELLAERDDRFAPGMPDSGGMRLGEGAVYACMETGENASARGAAVRGLVTGYGNAFEPPESEAILAHASRTAVRRAIEMALADASMEPGDIDLVCLSANGIELFDRAELEAVDAVLGTEVALGVPKAMFGEALGAGGAFGMAAVLGWFEGVPVRPLLRASHPEPPENVLVLAVGFYGNVSAVVMKRTAGV
jgi:3-oxoacyl-(acyl-carrier-protein) synthase